MVYESGHGPTRWLWPTAHDHPRIWVAGTDIPMKPEDQAESLTWLSSPGARARFSPMSNSMQIQES